MVRVISEKLFSPPRSRHSSGETVDKELAARAVEALSSLNSRRLEFSDYESSSDSHWDSELDLDGDCPESATGDQPAEGERRVHGTDVVRKRKERRRERNKKSAQAYRIRRKEQTVNQQKLLATLHEENSRLKDMVRNLETELEEVRHKVRHRLPATALPLPSTNTSPTPPFSSFLAATDTANTTTTTSPFTEKAQGEVGGFESEATPSFTLSLGPSFRQLAKRAAPTTSPLPLPEPAVDNDHSRRQQISPVVDNFSFSSSSSSSSFSRTAPSPSSSPVPAALTKPQAASFSFPSRGPLHPASPFPKPSSPLPTISERPVVQCGRFLHHHHHHHQQQQQQQQHCDLNANANAANANTLNANSNAAALALCQNDNMNTNNNNNNHHHLSNNAFLALGAGATGVGAGLLASKPAFQFSKA